MKTFHHVVGSSVDEWNNKEKQIRLANSGGAFKKKKKR